MDTAAIYKQKFLRTGVEPVTLGSQFFRYSPTLFQLSYRRPYTQQSGAVFHCRRVPRWHFGPGVVSQIKKEILVGYGHMLAIVSPLASLRNCQLHGSPWRELKILVLLQLEYPFCSSQVFMIDGHGKTRREEEAGTEMAAVTKSLPHSYSLPCRYDRWPVHWTASQSPKNSGLPS
jgi:hypothetical protein